MQHRRLKMYARAAGKRSKAARGDVMSMEKAMAIIEELRHGFHEHAVALQENFTAQGEADYDGGEGPTSSGAEEASSLADSFWAEVQDIIDGMENDVQQLKRLMP